MKLVSDSQASTYCSQAEQLIRRENAQTPLRRSQRLQEKSANQCRDRAKSTSPRNGYCVSPKTGTQRSTRSPPLFPSMDYSSEPIEIDYSFLKLNIKPDPSANTFDIPLGEARVASVSKKLPLPTIDRRPTKRGKRRITRKSRKRMTVNGKKVAVTNNRVQRTRGRPLKKRAKVCNQPEPSVAVPYQSEKQNISNAEQKQSDKMKNNINTNYINPNFPLADFSSEVMNAKRNRPIERYYVRPSDLGPTPGAPSILPAQYPSHFVHQLPPDDRPNMFNDYIVGEVQAEFQRVFHEKALDDYNRRKQETERFACPLDDAIRPTTEEMDINAINISDDLTDASLSDSMHEIFGTKSLRDVLNLEPIKYRFTEEHLSAVALILNVELPRLRGVMNLVQKLPPGDILRMAGELAGIGCISQFDMEVDEADDKSSDQQIESSQSPRPEQRQFPSQM